MTQFLCWCTFLWMLENSAQFVVDYQNNQGGNEQLDSVI